MRIPFICTAILLFNCSVQLGAQVESIEPGARIRVFSELQRPDSFTVGVFGAFLGEALTYTPSSSPNLQRIALDDIVRIDVRQSTLRNRLIGLPIGMLIGGFLGFAAGSTSETKSCWSNLNCQSGSDDPMAEGFLGAFGGILGGVAGYLIGGSIGPWKELRVR